jgi:hypothetical protein
MADADRTIVEVERLAGRIRQPLYLWYPAMWRAMRLLHIGRLDEARDAIERFREEGRRRRYPDAELVYCLQAFLLFRELGEAARVEPLVVRLQEDADRWRPVLALLAIGRGDAVHALELLDDYASSSFVDLPDDQSKVSYLVLLAEAAAETGHLEAAGRLFDLLLPWEGHHLVVGSGAVCYGSAHHALGLLSRVVGRPEEARLHFIEALRDNRRAGSQLFAAYSGCELALALAASEPDTAGTLLAFARSIAERHGSRRLGARVRTVAERLFMPSETDGSRLGRSASRRPQREEGS